MTEARILKRRIQYSSPLEESGHLLFTIRSKTPPTEDQLARLGIHARSCGHTHDCCGCWFGEGPSLPRRIKRNEWRVHQYFARNI